MNQPLFDPREVAPNPQSKLTEEELLASAQRNLAWGIMPSLVRANPKSTPTALVKRAYDIAKQMIKQGDKL